MQDIRYLRASRELVTTIPKTQDVSPSPTVPLVTNQNNSQNAAQSGVLADTAGNSEQSTVDNLRNWYSAANKLGKPEEYKNRIVQVATEFKSGHALSEKALTAMDRDIKELHSINRLTQIAQRVCDAMGQPGEGGSTQVSGKIYDVSFNLSSKHLTVSHKDGGVILDIKEGKIETNKISPDIIKNFEDTNAKLDAILFRKQAECREM